MKKKELLTSPLIITFDSFLRKAHLTLNIKGKTFTKILTHKHTFNYYD